MVIGEFPGRVTAEMGKESQGFRSAEYPERVADWREPGMGANVFSRPRTQRDPLRMSVQLKGSPFDSARR